MSDRPLEGVQGVMHVPARNPRPPAKSGRGWMIFAAAMLLISAVLNTVYGFSAIYNDDYLREESLLFGPVTMWGWLAVGFAVVEVFVAVSLLRGSAMGALAGIAIAGLSALAHLFGISAQPVYSSFVIAVDLLIIYGLSVSAFRHGAAPASR